jgi:hypothetical protein
LALLLLAVIVFVTDSPALAQPTPAWNRHLTGISLQESLVGGYDVTVEWRIALEGDSSSPVEIGTSIDLSIGGVPQATVDAEECLIWDLDPGGDCAVSPSGTVCGSAIISGKTVELVCGEDGGGCTTPILTATIADVALTVADEVSILLRPAPGAEPDSVANDDDDGWLTFGSWNRKLLSLDIVPTPGAGPGIFDVTAHVVFEIDGSSSVPLNLGIDLEPFADPCCKEACCCPGCSTECGGNGCVDYVPYLGDVILEIPAAGEPADVCPAGNCTGACAMMTISTGSSALLCDTEDCICRSDVFTPTWTGLRFNPGEEITLIIRPTPGALPELPGPDDSGTAIVPEAVPVASSYGLVAMVLLLAVNATLVFRRVVDPRVHLS